MDHSYSHSGVAARLLLTREPSRSVSPTDAELVASSVRDPDAFTQLFERHWEALFRFCQSRAGSAGEDIAAETFRVAFDRRRRYDARYGDPGHGCSGSPPTCCATTSAAPGARSRSSRARRRWMRSHQHDGEPGELERQLLGPQLAGALQGLPAGDRDALLLLAWADLDYEQIAQALDVPLGTVRSRIHRARQRVRDYLETQDDHRALNEA